MSHEKREDNPFIYKLFLKSELFLDYVILNWYRLYRGIGGKTTDSMSSGKRRSPDQPGGDGAKPKEQAGAGA